MNGRTYLFVVMYAAVWINTAAGRHGGHHQVSPVKVCSGNGEIDKITVNGTHLIDPDKFSESCRYEIPRQEGICQIRLDFIDFKIEQGQDAADIGDCNVDTFSVSGASNGIVGPLCGDLTGQHMYLNFDTCDINLNIFMRQQAQQRWNILITMIKCNSPEMAPVGCLQYHTTPTGIVRSFNYNNQVQLNNQDYTVCVRPQPGTRRINWKPCNTNPTMTTDFSISGGPPAQDPAGGNALGQSVSGTDCMLDWVMILGNNKYCGSQFPDAVVSASVPFILQVHFNEFEFPPQPPCSVPPPFACPGLPDIPGAPQPDFQNSGFCLSYSQMPF